MAKFIIMYRQYGPAEHQQQANDPDSNGQDDQGQQGRRKAARRSTPTTIQGNLANWYARLREEGEQEDFVAVRPGRTPQVSIPGKEPEGRRRPCTRARSARRGQAARAAAQAVRERHDLRGERHPRAHQRQHRAAARCWPPFPDLTEADVQAIIAAAAQASSSEPADARSSDTPAWLLDRGEPEDRHAQEDREVHHHDGRRCIACRRSATSTATGPTARDRGGDRHQRRPAAHRHVARS